VGERCEFSSQVQLTAFEGKLQGGDELAAEHAPQYGKGKEEAWMGSNPAGVIAGESAGGNDTVDMRMKLEFLFPSAPVCYDFSEPMTPEDREQMFDLCRRIDRETDPKKLALWIADLNHLIQGKINELRKQPSQRNERASNSGS
jgi:hypothetical protein